MLLWFAEGLLLSRVETKDRFWDIFSKESEVSDFLALSLLRTNISSLPSHYLSFFFFYFFFIRHSILSPSPYFTSLPSPTSEGSLGATALCCCSQVPHLEHVEIMGKSRAAPPDSPGEKGEVILSHKT